MDIAHIIKKFNEAMHFDLMGQNLYTLDADEVDDFITWAMKNGFGDTTEFFYTTRI